MSKPATIAMLLVLACAAVPAAKQPLSFSNPISRHSRQTTYLTWLLRISMPTAFPTSPPSWSAAPLHWAASSDDVDVAESLVAGGASLEAKGASIAGGTPLDNAVGYGCWRVARLLVERGAKVEKLWHAAALGLLSRVTEMCTGALQLTPEDLNDAFWQACHGGQRRVAEYLHARGADLNWTRL
jgi:hypothetical protein